MRKLCLFLALAAASLPARAAQWDVVFLAGQSNMDGRGKVSDLTAAQRALQENAMIFYRNPPAATPAFMPLSPGYSIAPGYKGGLPSGTFGPEIGFAAAWKKANPAAKLAFIKGSKGGTSLAKDWNPGQKGQIATQGPCYRNFLETVALANKTLPANGDTFVLRGVLWHQGESDAASSKEVYEERLKTFIARLREDLGQPNLPFVIGEVFDNGQRDAVRQAQRAVADTVPHCAFVSAEKLTTSDKGTHFDAASQLTLGELFAAALSNLK